MARIPLTIDPQYCADWSFWNGIRELIQNAKDADEYEGHKMRIRHSAQSQTLTIVNADISLPASLLLLLGASTKRGSEQRGKFGEGFALGVLALVRAGHPVTIYNGDEVWRPEITTPDEGHPFEGSQLLVFNTRKLQNVRTEFEVQVENVSKEVWDVTKKLFLFLAAPAEKETVKTPHGTVLLNEEYQGKIFSRGIFVTRNEEIECGYDLPHLELDRDRRAVDEWTLKYRLGEVWSAAQNKEPDKFAPRIYRMAKEEKAEVKSLHYHADKKLIDRLRNQFEEEHGEGTVPVATMQDSRELEELGAKTAVVNKTLMDLLTKSGPTLEETKSKLKTQLKKLYAWNSLTTGEIDACSTWVERVTKEYLIVDFNDATTSCRYVEDQKKVCIARTLLSAAPRDLVFIVAQQEARRRGHSTESVLLDVLFPPPATTENDSIGILDESIDVSPGA